MLVLVVAAWTVMLPFEKHGLSSFSELKELRLSYPCPWEMTGYPIFIKQLCLEAGTLLKRIQDFDNQAQEDRKNVRF